MIASQSKEVIRAWKNDVTPLLLYCVVTFAFGNLLFGVDTGSFGSIQALPSFISDFAPDGRAFQTETRSIMNSVVWPGKLLGTIAFEPIVQHLGYKGGLYSVGAFQSIGLIIQLTARNWQTFSGGRVICYFAVGIAENVVPSYLSEVAPSSLRGFFAGAMSLIVAAGNLWGAGMGRAYANEPTRIGWIIPVAVQFVPVLSIALLTPFAAESPRWLISRGHKAKAIAAMDRLRPAREVYSGRTTLEVEALEAAVLAGGAQEGGSWLDIFRGNYPRRTIIASLMFLANQGCGNQFINLYGPTFYKTLGLSELAFTYTMVSTGVAIVASLFAMLFVDTIGRRNILILGIGLSAIFLAVAGGVGVGSLPFSSTQINTIVASFCFVAIGNRMSVNPLSYVVATELGGVRMRKKILAVATAWDVVFAFAISYSVPYLLGTPGANLGAKVAFVFLGLCVFSLIFVIFFVPECSGRSLEEVDELFDMKLWAWQWHKATTQGHGRRIAELERGQGERSEKMGDEHQEQA